MPTVLTPPATVAAKVKTAKALSHPICVYSFTFHRWMGEHRIQIDNVKQVITGDKPVEEIAKDRVRPVMVQLIPAGWQRKLWRAYGKFDTAIESMTLPFVGRTRALPLAAQAAFWPEFQLAKAELDSVLDAFVAAYPVDVVAAAQAYWLDRLGPEVYFTKLASLMPAPDKVRQRFGVTPVLETLAVPERIDAAQAGIVAEMSQ